MNNIKDFLHYYINTGAEVEYVYQNNPYTKELDLALMQDSDIAITRFTNLIRVDELTDEQKVKLFDAAFKFNLSKANKIYHVNGYFINHIALYSPQLFHELLKLRVDLFNLQSK